MRPPRHTRLNGNRGMAPLIAPYSPETQNLLGRLKPPGFASRGRVYWLGSDELGRDLLSRLIWGARVSLFVATASVLLSAVVGTILGRVHGPSDSGIGWATAMRPHWRCWIRRRRPTSVSRCPGLLILVPKRQRAWCAAPCAILTSEEFLLVLVRQQRHTRAASPHASNRFSNSLPKVSPMRRSQPHCSFRSGPSNTMYPRSRNSASRRVKGAAKEARRLGLTHPD